MPEKILIVDDNEDILFSLSLLLEDNGFEITTIANPEQIKTEMKQTDFDLILLDMNFSREVESGHEGFYWLDEILKIDPDAVVIFITAYGEVEKAVKAIKAGAMDFVVKPWQNEKLLATILAGLNLSCARQESRRLKNKQLELNKGLNRKYEELIGKSREMTEIFSTLDKVAITDASILILGENGTGKELVASAIHNNSARSEESFIRVDLGSLTETLFESELFGHAKGAFTDAKQERVGRFVAASGGTIFLDEIGNLSLPMQAKLLSVIEKQEVIPVGSNKPVSIDIRLVCATNNNLADMVKAGSFREDLYYRINTVELVLPPLRERGDDIILLAENFLHIYGKKYHKTQLSLSSEIKTQLKEYHWPGNVRELRHVLERAVIMSDKHELKTEDFHLKQKSIPVSNEDLELNSFNLDEMEKQLISKVLKKYQGNISKTAKELGLSRAALYRRMEKHCL